MSNRRTFLATASLLSVGAFLGCASSNNTEKETDHSDKWYMPDEGELHLRTWMAFVANDYIWEDVQIPVVKKDLARIARTIAKYEPVSILVAVKDQALAKKLIGDKHNYPIDFYTCDTDDLWIRDTGPSFVINNRQEKAAVDFNFNGWGNKQEHILDSQVASFIAMKSKVPLINTNLTLEGGCFEINGQSNAIMTESCIINDNRNPNKTKKEIDEQLKSTLGLQNITWLKGIKDQDITDGHTDFYARFTGENIVLVSRDNYQGSHDYTVTRKNIDTLKDAKDQNNRRYTLHILDTPNQIHPIGNKVNKEDDFAAGYIGYYLCNGAVIMQAFGDLEADKKAYDTLAKLFPDRVIEQIRIDGIASGGGSIHCATQQEPKV